MRAPCGSSLVASLILAMASGACDLMESEVEAPGAGGAPIEGSDALADQDLDAITARGLAVFHQERMLRLAKRRGLTRVGASRFAALVPLATVDSGFHSGQVTYYRWMERDVVEGEKLDPAEAHRWLVVPMLLRPDRILENEQFSDPVEPGSDEYFQIEAVFAAREAALSEHPGGSWGFHPFRDQVREGPRRIWRTRVYLVGRDGSPDLEILVANETRKTPTSVLEIRRAFASPPRSAPFELSDDWPTPVALARALAAAPQGGSVNLAGSEGARWKVWGGTGEIMRLDKPVQGTEPDSESSSEGP